MWKENVKNDSNITKLNYQMSDFIEALRKGIEDRKDEFDPNMKNVCIVTSTNPGIAWVPNTEGVCDCGKKSAKKAVDKYNNHKAYACSDCYITMKFN